LHKDILILLSLTGSKPTYFRKDDLVEAMLTGLRAVAEPTRLRLLLLCAEAELTVSDLVGILGQSQPRVSRHLKLLCDAGLLDRFREGAYAFYRLARRGAGAELARALLRLVPEDDPVVALDHERLEALKRERAASAAAFFRANAPQWDKIRSLYVAEPEVETALIALLPADGIGDFLDVGTGTGRMLELFGPRVEHAVGVDLSREMLAVARVNLERAGLRNCSLRQGDMYQLPLPSETFEAAVFHQVLHYAEDPRRALHEAARVLKPGGRLAIVDFAPHDVEALRAEQAHRRLGFADEEMLQWCEEAGFDPGPIAHLPGEPLTVTLWSARRRLAVPQQRRAVDAVGDLGERVSP
jgi:ubiquinone/menaquinone biosynthesis C-methylase UbiE/DNA-binding transcriptional ArsR family regulator